MVRQDKNPIERVHKIDTVDLSEPIETNIESLKAKEYEHDLIYYAVPKDSALERIFDWVLDTLAGKNKEGKGLGKIKDVISWIIPKSKPIDWITDEIGDFIKSKRTDSAMRQESKKPTKSKTLIVNVLIGIASLLVLFGVIPADSVPLGEGAAWVGIATSIVNGVLRFFTKKPVSTKA